jgi:hypothetical protein|tara:strand:+ start:2737 stop:2853 length:117 start_codon:yes stop_codon:yes gene_type:complete
MLQRDGRVLGIVMIVAATLFPARYDKKTANIEVFYCMP